MSIENPTLAHFRHFSSLFTNLPSTSVENPLQISYFLCKTNPIFRKAKMNLSCLYTKYYKNFIPLAGQKNKPNSNPIKPNLQKTKMNVNSLITKDYRKKDDFVVRKNKPNSNPISVKPKMNVKLYVIEDYENETAFRPKKTNPNKPNFRKAKMNLKSLAGKSGHTRLMDLAIPVGIANVKKNLQNAGP